MERIEIRKDGTEVHYAPDGKAVQWTKDKNGFEKHYDYDGKTLKWTKDENGFERHYGSDKRVISYSDVYNGKLRSEDWITSIVVKQIQDSGELAWTKDKNGNETFYDGRGEIVLATPIKKGDEYTLIDRDGRKIYKEGIREGERGIIYDGIGIGCIVDTKGNTIYYHHGYISSFDYVKDKNGKEIHYEGNKVSWEKDKKGNVIYYYDDGKSVRTKEDQYGNVVDYYENGKISYMYDEKKNIEKRYREDGTLAMFTNCNTGTVTWYETDGKTVASVEKEGGRDTYERREFKKGKIESEETVKYKSTVDVFQYGEGKKVGYHYDDDGRVDHWTVDKWKEDAGEPYDKEPTKTYKKDDIKAITSGDVPGYAYIEANMQLYDDKGEPIWVKEAREKANKKITARKTDKTTNKKSTANALKAQKASQYIRAAKQSDVLTTPWAKDSQKKVEVKTAQKSKTPKSKTTAQKTTKTNGGQTKER